MNDDAPTQKKPGWLTWAKRLGSPVVVGLSLYYLWRRLAPEMDQISWDTLDPNIPLLLLSLLLTVVCVLLGGVVWQIVLSGFGHQLPAHQSVRIHCTANLAKYVPGYAWQLVGKAYLTQHKGVPLAQVTAALIYEYGGLLGTAVLVGLVAMPNGTAYPLIGPLSPVVRWGLVAMCAATLVAAPWLFSPVLRLVQRKENAQLTLNARRLWLATLLMALAWVIYGLGLVVLARSVHPLSIGAWPLTVGALAASFVVSLIVIFVPAGLGVRESVIVALLGAVIPGSIAVIVAILSRVALTLSELVSFALVWLLDLARRLGQKHHS